MRHNKKFNHLSRTASHRSAMLSNMACSLIKHKRITTTVAKAKALKKFVEPLITKSKEDTTNSRRVVFSYLQDKYVVTELFKEVSVKVADRPVVYHYLSGLGHCKGRYLEIRGQLCTVHAVAVCHHPLRDPERFSDRAHNGYRTHDGAFASICTDDERAESRAGKTVGKAVLPKYSGNSLCHVLELHQHGGSACHRNFW